MAEIYLNTGNIALIDDDDLFGEFAVLNPIVD